MIGDSTFSAPTVKLRMFKMGQTPTLAKSGDTSTQSWRKIKPRASNALFQNSTAPCPHLITCIWFLH